MSHREASPETRQAFQRYRGERCEKAFRSLVEGYGGLVTGTAHRVTGNGESARDVAQAVFADLARMAPDLPPETAVGGWLYRHALFLAMRRRRTDRRRGLREAEAHRRWTLESAGEKPPGWLADLDEMLGRLPEADRDILRLRYLENRPLKDAAAVLGIGADAAQKRAARALEKLRALLARRGFHGMSAATLPAAVSAFAPAPASASVLATAALRAAAASSAPAAGTWTTLLAMNLKPLLTGAAAAAAITGGLLAPVIHSQREKIAVLERQLSPPASAPPPTSVPRTRIPRDTAAAKPAKNTRQNEHAEFSARYDTQKERIAAWTDAVSQIDDAALKQRALAEMAAAMASPQEGEAFAALAAYRNVAQVEFDRAAFRPPIEGLLSHADPVLRRLALGFIAALPPDAGDIGRVSAMAQDPDYGVRKGVVSSLFWLTKGDLTGDAGTTVLGVLENAEAPSRSLIDAMWGANFSPELERKLVEFARAPEQPGDEQLAYYAVYSCLSTQTNKGPDCVDLLLERLTHPDSYNVGGRAAWGLGYGVQPGLGLEQKIADTALKVWQNRSTAYLRENLLGCIRQYGNASHADALDEIAAAPAMGAEQRKQLTDLAQNLRQRGAAEAGE